jgi:hypothetical protein
MSKPFTDQAIRYWIQDSSSSALLTSLILKLQICLAISKYFLPVIYCLLLAIRNFYTIKTKPSPHPKSCLHISLKSSKFVLWFQNTPVQILIITIINFHWPSKWIIMNPNNLPYYKSCLLTHLILNLLICLAISKYSFPTIYHWLPSLRNFHSRIKWIMNINQL